MFIHHSYNSTLRLEVSLGLSWTCKKTGENDTVDKNWGTREILANEVITPLDRVRQSFCILFKRTPILSCQKPSTLGIVFVLRSKVAEVHFELDRWFFGGGVSERSSVGPRRLLRLASSSSSLTGGSCSTSRANGAF